MCSEAFLDMVEVADGNMFLDETEMTEEQLAEIERLQEEFGELDIDPANPAEERVDAYLLDECGIDPDAEDDGEPVGAEE